MQQTNIYPPSTCLEIWLNEPRRAQNSQAPANLLRLWFPESIMAFDVRDNLLWQSTYEHAGSPWRYENLAIGDMKSGRKIHKVLVRSHTVDDMALMRCSIRWEGTEAHLALVINNISPVPWNRLVTSICLQRPAAPEYIDEDDSRTFVVSEGQVVASRDLVFPPDRQMFYGIVGDELSMQDGSKRRLSEEALFVVSRDGRYVLGFACYDAHRLFLNRALCVRCLHSDLEIRDIESKEVVQRRGILFLKEGTLDEAIARYQTWKETSSCDLSINEM